MTNVTILGATGSLGRAVTRTLLDQTDAHLTLFSRSATNLATNERMTTVSASVFDEQALEEAVQDADLVFAALSGDLPRMAEAITSAMTQVSSQRLVFITSYGIYGETSESRGQVPAVLRPYREAADIIEGSGLDYTILRPGWFDNRADTSYRLFAKGQMIDGHDISRRAIADVVRQMAENPELYTGKNLGIVR